MHEPVSAWIFPLQGIQLRCICTLSQPLRKMPNITNMYLLTPWSRVLFEKLSASQLVKKFLAFYGNRRFITVFTRARHLSLFWPRSN